MRYGILSDVHSNLEALDAVLACLNNERVDRLLCAGDLVGYGADPSLCLRRLRDNGVQCVSGNHDWAVAGRLDLNWFNPHARAALEWTAGRLTPEEKSTLAQLPLVWRDDYVTVVHSTLVEPEQFHYVLDADSARRSLDLQETSLAFIGHTHVPGLFVEEDGRVRFLRGEGVTPPPDFIQPSVGSARSADVPAAHKAGGGVRWTGRAKALVNAGSVGQPRDGDPRAAYCLVDTDARTVEIRRVPYSIERAQAKIQAAGLPGFLAERLAVGY